MTRHGLSDTNNSSSEIWAATDRVEERFSVKGPFKDVEIVLGSHENHVLVVYDERVHLNPLHRLLPRHGEDTFKSMGKRL